MLSTDKNQKSSLLIVILLMALLGTFVASRTVSANTNRIERVSLGTGSVESDAASYYLSLSDNAEIVTFESFNTNWGRDQSEENFVDIFVRDRIADVTTRISVGQGGEIADQRSFDPVVTADGRYVIFNSYATNLVSGDTNRHPWVDDGLDVFLYDRNASYLQRVTLNWKGEQIDANSVGSITDDGRYIIFTSDGNGIVEGDITNSLRNSAIYKRDWQTGAVERITKTPDGKFPEGGVGGADASSDGRYIVYISAAPNLIPGDTNEQVDILLYDSVTGETELISRPVGGGQSNNMSSPVRISADGRYIAFRSFATNLVPNDNNGVADIFVYDQETKALELVSLSSTGAQANGESKDPGICGDGRYVVFTSEATNLVSTPHNGQRQIYVRDRLLNRTFLATANANGDMSNGRAHRGTLSDDCKYVGFATDATNIIPNDNNGVRDLFIAYISYPADLSTSNITASGLFDPGKTVKYTITLRNTGTEDATIQMLNPIPANSTYVGSSLVGAGAIYNGVQNQIEWNGTIPGQGEVTIFYAATTDADLTDFMLITNEANIIGNGINETVTFAFAVNGLKTYMPVAARQ